MPTTYSTYIPEESQEVLEKRISGWLRYLGIYGTLAGHKYLVTAIMQTIPEPDRVRYVTKELYPDIAKLYHTTMSRVERAMRTAVKTCWETGGREALNQMAGFHLHQRPTNSEFIDLAAAFFRR